MPGQAWKRRASELFLCRLWRESPRSTLISHLRDPGNAARDLRALCYIMCNILVTKVCCGIRVGLRRLTPRGDLPIRIFFPSCHLRRIVGKCNYGIWSCCATKSRWDATPPRHRSFWPSSNAVPGGSGQLQRLEKWPTWSTSQALLAACHRFGDVSLMHAIATSASAITTLCYVISSHRSDTVARRKLTPERIGSRELEGPSTEHRAPRPLSIDS